jgi:DNA primase
MTILTLLSDILGSYTQQKDEYLFCCPFCHGSKKKLSINIATNKWKCWVCGSKGGHILWLLKRLSIPAQVVKQFKELFGEEDIRQYKATEAQVTLHLPPEYVPLWKPVNSYPYRHALSYLLQRGIGLEDILRYRIGYCESGIYGGRIIIPSYDATSQLNYFTARSFYDTGMKYKNPPVSKNTVIFENMIDWNECVVLVEGMFDALAIRQNAIPLMGKTISKKLEHALLTNNTKEVIIFLDNDARLDALKLQQKLQQYRMDVRVVETHHKDANDMGYTQSWQLIRDAATTSFKDFIHQKLQTVCK